MILEISNGKPLARTYQLPLRFPRHSALANSLFEDAHPGDAEELNSEASVTSTRGG